MASVEEDVPSPAVTLMCHGGLVPRGTSIQRCDRGYDGGRGYWEDAEIRM